MMRSETDIRDRYQELMNLKEIYKGSKLWYDINEEWRALQWVLMEC